MFILMFVPRWACFPQVYCWSPKWCIVGKKRGKFDALWEGKVQILDTFPSHNASLRGKKKVSILRFAEVSYSFVWSFCNTPQQRYLKEGPNGPWPPSVNSQIMYIQSIWGYFSICFINARPLFLQILDWPCPTLTFFWIYILPCAPRRWTTSDS